MNSVIITSDLSKLVTEKLQSRRPSLSYLIWRDDICSRAALVMNVNVRQVYTYLDCCGCGERDFSLFRAEKVQFALAKMNRALLEDYFNDSKEVMEDLSVEERAAFLSFGLHYSKTGRPVKTWKDIDLEKIDADFWAEMEELSEVGPFALLRECNCNVALRDVRKSELYNLRIRCLTKVKRASVFLREIAEVFRINRYHIFTSEPDSNIFSSNLSVNLGF